jgi:hypothetical protein
MSTSSFRNWEVCNWNKSMNCILLYLRDADL